MGRDQITKNFEEDSIRRETYARVTGWMGLQDFNEGNLPIEWTTIMVAKRMPEVDQPSFSQKR